VVAQLLFTAVRLFNEPAFSSSDRSHEEWYAAGFLTGAAGFLHGESSEIVVGHEHSPLRRVNSCIGEV